MRNWPFERRAVIGMVHVGAIPGSPGASASVADLVADAVDEARVLADAGFDGIIVENMHDRPYVHGAALGPESVAVMTRVARAVREATPLPIGVQILSGGNRHALAAALAAGGAFIRCENFVFSHVADEGLLAEAEAGPLLRYRRSIGAEGLGVYCDVKKKHASQALTSDLSVGDCAEAAEFFGADAVIVTGTATGRPTRGGDVAEARAAVKIPVLVGSGVEPGSVGPLFEHADALVVGSYIKADGLWSNAVDARRCGEIVRAADATGR
jgi:membrane complex biogenesis BtpA family protein